MLFHITGPAGSGKTTLGNKLSKIPNTMIIDTDEIDDSNAMDIISDTKFNELFKLLKKNKTKFIQTCDTQTR